MVSPPKPWERAGSVAAQPQPAAPAMAPASSATTSSTVEQAPTVPNRPSSLASPTATTSAYSSAYTSPYSRFNSYSPYGSTYGGYGGAYPGSSMYGGMGGYGGMYGGGMGYGGMYGGGMGMGMGGLPYDPNNPSLTQRLEATTQQTFGLLQSIVQTFGGFAQMLESTFMATHSSFFAMVGVAEQFSHLRNALAQVLGMFGLVRWLRQLLTGQRQEATGLSDEFERFLTRPPGAPAADPNRPPAQKASKKPLIIFLLAIFGIPYLMNRLIKALAARQLPPNTAPTAGQIAAPPGVPIPVDPSKLTFARAMYPFETTDPVELALRRGEIVAIMGTTDPVTGLEGEWWRGRTREGKEGWFPKAFVEIIKKAEEAAPAPKTVD